MSSQHKEGYEYKNYVSKCPNCGAMLSDNMKDCPACGINLVGYNEESNRANNMTDYASVMNDLAEQNDILNDKIRKRNNQISKDEALKKKSSKILTWSMIIVGAIAIFVPMVYGLVTDSIDALNSQTYDEVVEHFNECKEDPIVVKPYNLDEWEIKKYGSSVERDYTISFEQGYDQSTGTTFLKESCSFEDKSEYSVVRILNQDVSHVPTVDAQWGHIDYSGSYKFIDFEDSFVQHDANTSDEFVLKEYVNEENNFVTKMAPLQIGDTVVDLYWIGVGIDSSRYHHIVGVVELEDNVFYVSEIATSSSGVEIVLSEIENYFHIQQERIG